MESLAVFEERLERRALTPLTQASWRFKLWVGFLLALIGAGVYAYFTQLQNGLVVTGMRDRTSWGLYITLFVFFIGISHAGTLISAILRASGAGWRTPVTRMAEFITVVALMVGGILPIIDLGRPDRIPNLILHGRWQSPIIWDVLAISTYFIASAIYLFLPLIPDFAIARDRLPARTQLDRARRAVYSTLALGWNGSATQVRHHATALKVMMILIIPIAVSVHTVVSWIFAMTLREPWNSTLFGAFFVAGAIFSGIAMLIIVMYILRRVYHLEEYITAKHFRYLGYLMAVFAGIMIYANVSEQLVPGYKGSAETVFAQNQLYTGPLAGIYWYYIVGALIIPGALFLIPWARNRTWVIVGASVMVLVGMFIERYFIVVGGLRVPLQPYDPRAYWPTWVESMIAIGLFALFALLITLFTKLVPIVSMWEVEEETALEAHPEPVPRLVTEPGPVAAPAGGGD